MTSLGLALALVIGIGIMTSYYTVGPEAVGVVRRFGAYNPPARSPGLHFKIPFGVDQVDIVQTQRQLKAEFGFRTDTPGVRTRYSTLDFTSESVMLTGDLNVAVVDWTVQYRITDPYRYKFRVKAAEDTFRYMSQAVMREIANLQAEAAAELD